MDFDLTALDQYESPRAVDALCESEALTAYEYGEIYGFDGQNPDDVADRDAELDSRREGPAQLLWSVGRLSVGSASASNSVHVGLLPATTPTMGQRQPARAQHDGCAHSFLPSENVYVFSETR